MYHLYALALWWAGPGDASPLPSTDLPSYGGLLLKTIVALAIVIGLVWVLGRWGLRRLLPGQSLASGEIQVVDRQAVDGRRAVVLVKAYDRYLLLGVAEGSVTLLAELDAEAVAEAERRRAAQPRRSFADVLRETLGRKPTRVEPIGAGPAPTPETDADEKAEDKADA